MLQLVSLDQAHVYLRRTTSADDADVLVMIQAASRMVRDHLASGPGVSFLDSDGEAVTEDSDGVAQDVDPVAQSATLYLTSIMYRYRDEVPDNLFPDGRLPYVVQALLGPLRDPVMA